MIEINCPTYENCKSPICPLDSSFTKAVWYPDEQICPAKRFRREHWRIIQRKIAKVHLARPVDGYFSLKALKDVRRVAKGISGQSPDYTPVNSLVRSYANGENLKENSVAGEKLV